MVILDGQDSAQQLSDDEDNDDESMQNSSEHDEDEDSAEVQSDTEASDDTLHYEGERRRGQDYLGPMRVAWKREHHGICYHSCPRGANCSFACFSICSMDAVLHFPPEWIESHGLGPWYSALSRRTGIGKDELLFLLYAATGGMCLDQLCNMSRTSDAQTLALLLSHSGHPWTPCKSCVRGGPESFDFVLLQRWLQHPSSSLEDWVADCVAMGHCTECSAGIRKVHQDAWFCSSCQPQEGQRASFPKSESAALVCTSCARICHKGHKLSKAGQREFVCRCAQEDPEKCGASDFNIRFKGLKYLPRSHAKMWFGEYLRSISERSRLRGAVLRCVLLCLEGRGHPRNDTQSDLCQNVFHMLCLKGAVVDSAASRSAPSLLRNILLFV